MPKAIKDDNSHIDEAKNNGYTHHQSNTEINSLAPSADENAIQGSP